VTLVGVSRAQSDLDPSALGAARGRARRGGENPIAAGASTLAAALGVVGLDQQRLTTVQARAL
jgi:hypothetical protein